MRLMNWAWCSRFPRSFVYNSCLILCCRFSWAIFNLCACCCWCCWFFLCSPRFLFSHTVRMNVNSFRLQILFYLFVRFLAICIALWNLNTKGKKGNQNQQERRRNIGVFVDLWIAGVFFCMYDLCVMHTGDSKWEWKSFVKDILLLFLFLVFFLVGREKRRWDKGKIQSEVRFVSMIATAAKICTKCRQTIQKPEWIVDTTRSEFTIRKLLIFPENATLHIQRWVLLHQLKSATPSRTKQNRKEISSDFEINNERWERR